MFTPSRKHGVSLADLLAINGGRVAHPTIMNKKIKNELLYGTRALMRDNWFCQRQVQDLRKNEHLSAKELSTLQNTYLHRSLQAAIRNLPFYQHISPKFSVQDAPKVLREQFPIIDKSTLLANRSTLYPTGGQPRPGHAVGKTSGTTGTPLTIFRSLDSVLQEQAFIKRHWTWAGYTDGASRVTLRGDLVVPLEQSTPPFWFWNRYNRQLLISSRHLQEPYIDAIILEIRKLRPHALQAYPSTAYTLAQFLQQRDQLLHIPFLFSASEPLYPHQRELILERLGSTVMDMYGMAERVAFATGCEHGNMHINPDYSYVEIVDENGQPSTSEGFIVGTTFHNLAMPLVRYRLSDRTRWKTGQCPCGRPFPMIEPVTGKLEDGITGSNGVPVSPSVLTFAFKGVENIKKSQVAQVAEAHWQIRLVPMPGFGQQDEQKLIDNIHQLVDAGVKVEVLLKEDIANTAAGKFRWVVNEMKSNQPPVTTSNTDIL